MKAEGVIGSHFNTALFTNGDSTQPEIAGSLAARGRLGPDADGYRSDRHIPVGVGAAVWRWRSSRPRTS